MKTLLLLLFPLLLTAQPAPVIYSFRTDGEGGLARLAADPATGALLIHERLFQEPGAAAIRKVYLSQDGRWAAANLDGVEDFNNLLVFDLTEGGRPRYLSIPGEVDPVGFFHNRIYAGSKSGALHRIHPETLAIEATWNFRRQLTPSGRRPEDLFLDAEANILWVSFQKDSRNQRHRGSRIVGISLETDEIIADLQLPRDRPELHYPPEIDGREAGPNPEVLHISPATNTLFVTLDLYGAVGMADLDAARRGELVNWTVLSTAPDGSWGTAFPDRVGRFQLAGRELLVVANASAAGGVAFIDVARRSFLQQVNSPGGLSTLFFLPSLNMVISGSPGKNKARTETGLSNVSVALPTWNRFQLTPDGTFALRSDDLGQAVNQVFPVSPANSPWVFLNLGENADHWQIIHPDTLQVTETFPAFGTLQRFGL